MNRTTPWWVKSQRNSGAVTLALCPLPDFGAIWMLVCRKPHVTVPDGVEKYEEKYFCSTCRELLEAYAQCGFVLADLRNPETPTIYP